MTFEKHSFASEFDQWRALHPDVRYIDAFVNDLNNIARGKRIPIGEVEKIWREGLFMPGSLLCLDATGDDLDPKGHGISDGDPDGIWHPIPGTLSRIPWAREAAGQVLLMHQEVDGSISKLDPRAILVKMAHSYRELGLTPIVAVELEFYLIDPQSDNRGFPLPPLSPGNGLRESSKQPYSIADLDVYQKFVADIAHAASVQNVPASTAITEFSPGQFEINLIHQADILAAADHAVLLKRIIQNIAIQHGFRATFMAKPFLEAAGSGMHVHISMQNRQGQNIFAAKEPEGSIELRHAIGGILASASESMAFLAPNANSYRRYQPGSHVARQASWGVNNRSVACRIPLGPPEGRRIEHRLAGADGNPYLILSSILAGMFYGLENKIMPKPALTGDATREITMPVTWWESLEALRRGTILKTYIGEDYTELYLEAKEREMRRFYDIPTALEYSWYL